MGAILLPRHFFISGLFVLISIAILPGIVQCQEILGSLRFLLIAPDARGKSLAGGGSAFSKGAASAYYNPALLATSEDFSAEINEHEPNLYDGFIMNIFMSRKFNDWICLGAGYTGFDYEIGRWIDYGNTTVLDWRGYRDYALGLWAAISFDHQNSFGIGFKYIKTHPYSDANCVGYTGTSSIAFDFGWLTKNHLSGATWRNDEIFYPDLNRLFNVKREKGFAFGVSFANLGNDLNVKYAAYPERMPKRLRLAAGYQAVDSEPVGLRLIVDATKLLFDIDDTFKEEWSEVAWAYGLEATFYYILDFRLGRLLDRGDHQRYTTIGFGLGPEWLGIDYSYVLESDEHWNRAGKEYSISISCNISPGTFTRD